MIIEILKNTKENDQIYCFNHSIQSDRSLYQDSINVFESSIKTLTNLLKFTYDDIFYK